MLLWRQVGQESREQWHVSADDSQTHPSPSPVLPPSPPPPLLPLPDPCSAGAWNTAVTGFANPRDPSRSKAYGYAPFGGIGCQTGPRGPAGCPFQFHGHGSVNDGFFVNLPQQPWVLFSAANPDCTYFYYVTEDQRVQQTLPVGLDSNDLSGHLISYQHSLDAWSDIGLLRGDRGDTGPAGATGGQGVGTAPFLGIDVTFPVVYDGTIEDSLANDAAFQSCAGQIVTVMIDQDQRSDRSLPTALASYGDLTGELLFYLCDSQTWALIGPSSPQQQQTLVYRGEWDSQEVYQYFNVVQVGRSTFVMNNSASTVQGGPSPDTLILNPNADWRPLALGGSDGSDGQNGTNGSNGTNGTNGTNGADGADGADGQSLRTTGAWAGSSVYQALDVITWQGGSYICNTAGTTGCDPSQCPQYWDLLADQGVPGLNGEPFHLSFNGDVTNTWFTTFDSSACGSFLFGVIQNDLRSDRTLPAGLGLSDLSGWLIQYTCATQTWTALAPWVATQGVPGTSFSHVGAWSVGSTYQLNQVVTYLGSSFVSKTTDNVGNTPSALADTSDWGIVALAGAPASTIPDFTFAGLGAGTGTLGLSLPTSSITALAPWTISVGTGLHNDGAGGVGVGNLNLTTGFYTVPTTEIYDIQATVALPGSIANNILANLTFELRSRVGAAVSKTNDPILLSTQPSNVTVLTGLVTLQLSNQMLTLAGKPKLTAGDVVYLGVANNSASLALSLTLSSVSAQSHWSIQRLR